MPAQDRVGREQRARFLEQFSAKLHSPCGQSTTLVVGEQDSIFAKLLFEALVFCAEILDDMLFSLIGPTGKDRQREINGLQNEWHGARMLGNPQSSGAFQRFSIVGTHRKQCRSGLAADFCQLGKR